VGVRKKALTGALPTRRRRYEQALSLAKAAIP
jgi:hypothetical protein